MSYKDKITEINIVPIKPTNGLMGFLSFVYDNNFYMSGIGIYTRPQGGFRLTYPTRKNSINEGNIFHPINGEITRVLEDIVEEKMNEIIINSMQE